MEGVRDEPLLLRREIDSLLNIMLNIMRTGHYFVDLSPCYENRIHKIVY